MIKVARSDKLCTVANVANAVDMLPTYESNMSCNY